MGALARLLERVAAHQELVRAACASAETIVAGSLASTAAAVLTAAGAWVRGEVALCDVRVAIRGVEFEGHCDARTEAVLAAAHAVFPPGHYARARAVNAIAAVARSAPDRRSALGDLAPIVRAQLGAPRSARFARRIAGDMETAFRREIAFELTIGVITATTNGTDIEVRAAVARTARCWLSASGRWALKAGILHV